MRTTLDLAPTPPQERRGGGDGMRSGTGDTKVWNETTASPQRQLPAPSHAAHCRRESESVSLGADPPPRPWRNRDPGVGNGVEQEAEPDGSGSRRGWVGAADGQCL